jgi:hypothetical protein
MPNSWNEILTARQGSVVVNKLDDPFIQNMYVVTSISDITVITQLLQDGVDVIADYITSPGDGIPKGGVITPIDIKKPFTSITLSAGAVCVTLGSATPGV